MHMYFLKFFNILCTALCLIIDILRKCSCIKYECFFRKDFISLWHLKFSNQYWLFSSFLKAEKKLMPNLRKWNFVQNRARSCKIVQNRAKSCKIVQLKWKRSKNVHLKVFWTLFKNVHCQGPCSLRPCISRPYCNCISIACFLLYFPSNFFVKFGSPWSPTTKGFPLL